MRIEITGLNIRELLEVIKNFDKGLVVVDHDKAYWEFELKAKNIQPVTNPQLQTQGVTQNIGQGVERMQKALFSAFGSN